MSEYVNRRYNKNETSKQFYLRRKKEMDDYFANPYYKIYEKKMWDEYKKANIIYCPPYTLLELFVKKNKKI